VNVLVDTCIWSLALRRNRKDLKTEDSRLVEEFAELIRERNVEELNR